MERMARPGTGRVDEPVASGRTGPSGHSFVGPSRLAAESGDAHSVAGFLKLRSDPAPRRRAASSRTGYVVLEAVFDARRSPPSGPMSNGSSTSTHPIERGDTPEQAAPFRYEMLNRSSLVQRAVAHPRILEVVEPLLGEDCHVIANTAWWQQPGDNDHLGRFWHIDAGPHVPRGPGVPWDTRIPYPIFAVATHLYLWDCPIEAGPTGVIPGSHTSGLAPPMERLADDDLEWKGRGAVPIVARAGDVALFVSDLWHRRMPPGPGDPGRMFIQCHYGRRDIAQRIRPTSSVNHLSPEAVSAGPTPREQNTCRPTTHWGSTTVDAASIGLTQPSGSSTGGQRLPKG